MLFLLTPVSVSMVERVIVHALDLQVQSLSEMLDSTEKTPEAHSSPAISTLLPPATEDRKFPPVQ